MPDYQYNRALKLTSDALTRCLRESADPAARFDCHSMAEAEAPQVLAKLLKQARCKVADLDSIELVRCEDHTLDRVPSGYDTLDAPLRTTLRAKVTQNVVLPGIQLSAQYLSPPRIETAWSQMSEALRAALKDAGCNASSVDELVEQLTAQEKGVLTLYADLHTNFKKPSFRVDLEKSSVGTQVALPTTVTAWKITVRVDRSNFDYRTNLYTHDEGLWSPDDAVVNRASITFKDLGVSLRPDNGPGLPGA